MLRALLQSELSELIESMLAVPLYPYKGLQALLQNMPPNTPMWRKRKWGHPPLLQSTVAELVANATDGHRYRANARLAAHCHRACFVLATEHAAYRRLQRLPPQCCSAWRLLAVLQSMPPSGCSLRNKLLLPVSRRAGPKTCRPCA